MKRLSYEELCEEVVRLRELLRAQQGGDGDKELRATQRATPPKKVSRG